MLRVLSDGFKARRRAYSIYILNVAHRRCTLSLACTPVEEFMAGRPGKDEEAIFSNFKPSGTLLGAPSPQSLIALGVRLFEDNLPSTRLTHREIITFSSSTPPFAYSNSGNRYLTLQGNHNITIVDSAHLNTRSFRELVVQVVTIAQVLVVVPADLVSRLTLVDELLREARSAGGVAALRLRAVLHAQREAAAEVVGDDLVAARSVRLSAVGVGALREAVRDGLAAAE